MNPRVWAFFALAVVAGAQYPAVQHAYLEVEASADGRQRATLSLSPAIDTRMKEAFARAAGCLPGDLQPERYGSRVRVRCAASRPDRLRVHTELRFDALAPLLASAGIRVVDVSLVAPRMDDVNIEPPMPASGLYHHASYSLDELPEKIAVDAGFGPRHLRNLAAGIAGLLLLPFILAVLRARNIPQLYALVQATFLAGWTGWTWILARTQAWTLCDLASGIRFAGPLLLVATPLAAVWVGSQLAAIQYARIAPEGSDEAAYRRSKFWIGALIVFLFSTIVGLFSAIESSQLGWTWAGIAATVLCVVQLYRSSRGGSYALPEGPLRARIFALAAQAGVRLRGVTILLGSERRPPAAFATRWGVILLTESLVRNLSRREVDAVVCHEFSHMNPTRSAGMAGIYVAVVATVMGAQFAPGMIQALPLAIVGSVLLFKAWRRSEERKADRDSVRWSRDPEALISGLTRGSRAAGMPLEWGPPVSWMIGHPSTAERFRLIAQAGNLPGSRIAELMEQATAEAADRYEVGDSVSQEAMFPTILKQRLKTRLALLALGGPAIFGFAATWILRKAGLGTWPVIAIAVPAASAAFYACYEWMVGGVRENVRRRWLAREGAGIFVGLSPAPAPRLFDGSYQYDSGMVKFSNGTLEFVGDRASFGLDRRLVHRVWLGDGPRHWTPRKVVYIEYANPGEDPAVFSLQSFEAHFWPRTTSAARALYRQIEAWRAAQESALPPPLPCEAPRSGGDPDPSVALPLVLKSAAINAGAGYMLAEIFGSSDISSVWDFSAPLVCVCVTLFAAWPRLRPRG